LSFIFCFDLLTIRLSQSHNMGSVFDRLSRVDLVFFSSQYVFKNMLS
jgi:hypothetical protein